MPRTMEAREARGARGARGVRGTREAREARGATGHGGQGCQGKARYYFSLSGPRINLSSGNGTQGRPRGCREESVWLEGMLGMPFCSRHCCTTGEVPAFFIVGKTTKG